MCLPSNRKAKRTQLPTGWLGLILDPCAATVGLGGVVAAWTRGKGFPELVFGSCC